MWSWTFSEYLYLFCPPFVLIPACSWTAWTTQVGVKHADSCYPSMIWQHPNWLVVMALNVWLSQSSSAPINVKRGSGLVTMEECPWLLGLLGLLRSSVVVCIIGRGGVSSVHESEISSRLESSLWLWNTEVSFSILSVFLHTISVVVPVSPPEKWFGNCSLSSESLHGLLIVALCCLCRKFCICDGIAIQTLRELSLMYWSSVLSLASPDPVFVKCFSVPTQLS